MKKFKMIIVLLTGVYIFLVITMYLVMNHAEDKRNDEYRVEINRLGREIYEGEELEGDKASGNKIIYMDLTAYSKVYSITSISYLSKEVDDLDIIDQFYTTHNSYQMEVVPVIRKERLTGYLRFDYTKSMDISSYLFMICFFLSLIYVIAVSALIYTHQKIVKPFHQLSNMPYNLSRGNFSADIKESKNRYFGRFIWGIGMLKDVLDSHKNQELKLIRDKKLLLLSISHDIKTPLNAINLYAKALEQDIYETEAEKIESLAKIQEKTAEINEFVQEIIKSSTEDVVSIEVKDSEYYLADLVKKVTADYSEKCNINKMNFEIGDFENHLLRGDIDRMHEAIGNLIENVFKYGDGKKLAITFSEEDYCVLIHIYNSGIPVNENEISHLFDSFYRGSNTEGRAGNGLGLYICNEIMKKMHGDIFVKRYQEGMDFVLVCPMS